MENLNKEWLKNHQQQTKEEPIHKFNNGRGATLCHNCGVIITKGLTEDLYCDNCSERNEKKNSS